MEGKLNWLINYVSMIDIMNTYIQVKVQFAKQYLVKVYFAMAMYYKLNISKFLSNRVDLHDFFWWKRPWNLNKRVKP